MRCFLVPLVASVIPLVACAMPSASAHVEAPPILVDVDARRAEIEHALCTSAHDDSDGCKVLRALDASDGEVSFPPRFPEFLPESVEIQDKRAHRDVARWLKGIDDVVPELRLPVGGVVDGQLLHGAELLDARVGVVDDTLTFAMPALRIAVAFAGGAHEHEIALVERGATDGAPIFFVRGGVDKLLQAAQHDDGEMIIRAERPALDEGPDATLVTPAGSVGLQVRLQVSGELE